MEALFVLAVLVAMPLMWVSASHLLAHVGGWQRLASLFSTSRPRDPAAASFHFQSSKIGTTRYKSALRFDVQPDGLRVSVLLPFRPGHPPVLIPYGEIADIERTSWLGFKTYTMTVGAPEVATMTLPHRVVEAMRDAVPTARLADDVAEEASGERPKAGARRRARSR